MSKTCITQMYSGNFVDLFLRGIPGVEGLGVCSVLLCFCDEFVLLWGENSFRRGVVKSLARLLTPVADGMKVVEGSIISKS